MGFDHKFDIEFENMNWKDGDASAQAFDNGLNSEIKPSNAHKNVSFGSSDSIFGESSSSFGSYSTGSGGSDSIFGGTGLSFGSSSTGSGGSDSIFGGTGLSFGESNSSLGDWNKSVRSSEASIFSDEMTEFSSKSAGDVVRPVENGALESVLSECKENLEDLTVREVEDRALDVLLWGEKREEIEPSESLMSPEGISSSPEVRVSKGCLSQELARTKCKPVPKCRIDKYKVFKRVQNQIYANGQEHLCKKIHRYKCIERVFNFLLILCTFNVVIGPLWVALIIDWSTAVIWLVVSYFLVFVFAIPTSLSIDVYENLYSENVSAPLRKEYFSSKDLPKIQECNISTLNTYGSGNVKLFSSLKPFHPFLKSVVASHGFSGQYREHNFECYLDFMLGVKDDRERGKSIKGQLYILPLKHHLSRHVYITERTLEYTARIEGSKEFKTDYEVFNQRFRLELCGARDRDIGDLTDQNHDEVLSAFKRIFDREMLQAFLAFDEMAESDTMMSFVSDKLYVFHVNDREVTKAPKLNFNKCSIDDLIHVSCEHTDRICQLLDLLYKQTGDLLA